MESHNDIHRMTNDDIHRMTNDGLLNAIRRQVFEANKLA